MEKEIRLCKKCLQMTNHRKVLIESIPSYIWGWVCLKCEAKQVTELRSQKKGNKEEINNE